MRVQIQLVHAEAGRRVVLASALDAKGCVAEALGEADNAEAAEDRARSRLAQQLGTEMERPQPGLSTPSLPAEGTPRPPSPPAAAPIRTSAPRLPWPKARCR